MESYRKHIACSNALGNCFGPSGWKKVVNNHHMFYRLKAGLVWLSSYLFIYRPVDTFPLSKYLHCIPIYLWPSVHPYRHPSMHPAVHDPSIHLSVQRSTCAFACVCVCVCVLLFICLSSLLSIVYVTLCRSVYSSNPMYLLLLFSICLCTYKSIILPTSPISVCLSFYSILLSLCSHHLVVHVLSPHQRFYACFRHIKTFQTQHMACVCTFSVSWNYSEQDNCYLYRGDLSGLPLGWARLLTFLGSSCCWRVCKRKSWE